MFLDRLAVFHPSVVLVKGRTDGVEVLGIQVILSDPKGIPEAKYEFLGFAIASISRGQKPHEVRIHGALFTGYFRQVLCLSFLFGYDEW